MPFTAKIWQELWWLAVLAVALLLKHHYSTATAEELAWVLRPLALLLQWFSGHSFLPDGNGEWLSYSADVRLVKGCAGVNFMIMSFIIYARLFRPDKPATNAYWLHITGQILLLCAAITAAWATTLFANSLRILVALTAASQHWELSLIKIDANQLHRFIGMAVYLPVLWLQMMLGRTNARTALLVPLGLYLLLMVIVPLLTGNAFQNLTLFREHLYLNLIPLVIAGLLFLLQKPRRLLQLACNSDLY